MAYQNPKYSWRHALAEAGAANVSFNGTLATGSEEEYLFDYRPSSLFIWSAAATDRWIKVNRLASPSWSVDRMIVPAGHNLDAAAFKLQRSATGAFGGEEVDIIDDSFSGSGLQSFTCTATAEQYLRLIISTSGAWEIPQLYLTKTETTSRGPDPGWDKGWSSVAIERELRTRSVNAILSANRLAVKLKYRRLQSADQTVFENLLAGVGVNALPFYFDPFDSGDSARYMRILDRQVDLEQDHPSPKSAGERYQIEFSMIEETT